MADVAVDVSGLIETPDDFKPTQNSILPSFLNVPSGLPDPKEWIQKQKQNVRPWLQFLQTSNFRTPPSVKRLSRRIMRNIEYFQSNYLFVFLGLIIYCLVTSPFLLLAVVASLYAGYRLSKRHAEKKTVVLGKELTLAQQYGLVSLCSIPVFYMVGAGAAMFWVLGASLFIITLHASFYNIEALIAEDDQLLLSQEV